jgi:serine/threonine protein kinase
MAVATRAVRPGAELGDRFDGARVLRSGSRFTIYAAYERAARRSVAIKVPARSSASWVHDQLEHEARILTATSAHPHVITLFERLPLDDGRPALLLERCSASFDDSLGIDHRMPLQAATALGIKIAGALETVHGAGVIHGDVRPSNVLVTEAGEPVLAGFDESVRLDAGSNYPPLHVTTPHTAPEVLEGAAPTPASDVYGLASTLYELVAGRAAFRAYAGESAAAVIVRVLSNPVRPITAPGVPLELSDLLTWSMAADPGRRPPSPAWLAEELGRVQTRQGWPRTHLTVL